MIPLPQIRAGRHRAPARRRAPAPRRLEPLEPRLLLAAGDLDPTFGTGGTLLAPFGSRETYDFIRAIDRAPDGRIVVLGDAGAQPRIGVARYLADGTPDSTFGVGGFLTLTFPPGDGLIAEHFPGDVAVLNDGSILVASGVVHVRPGDVTSELGLVRLDAAGRPDPTFGAGGFVSTRILRTLTSSRLAIQPDGRIVVAASTSPTNGANPALAAARYLPDGRLDATFGDAGVTIVSPAPPYADFLASDVAVAPDGAMVVSGFARRPEDPSPDGLLLRLDADGRLDPTFAGGGLIVGPAAAATGSPFTALHVLPDGGLVVAGHRDDALALTKFDAAGRLDPAFGRGGVATAPLPGRAGSSAALLVQPDGRILVGGAAIAGDNEDFALARFLPDGAVDTSFGDQGIVITSFAPESSDGSILRIDPGPDGTLLVAGEGRFPRISLALARYFADDRPPAVAGLRRVGVHARRSRLVLTFDRPLDPARAVRLPNYVLTSPGPDGRLGTADDRRVRLRRAAYHADTRAVVLTPVCRLDLHRRHLLRLDGRPPDGIADVVGSPLRTTQLTFRGLTPTRLPAAADRLASS
jgi:uncharacterized delta-60 repeat protein